MTVSGTVAPSDQTEQPPTWRNQPVRKRAKHTRTKNGCRVCRIRRVRCDLTKPACRRCTSTGRKCEGFPPDFLTSTVCGPNTVLTNGPAIGRFLGTGPDLDNEERSSLAFFQNRTASHLGGYLEDHFWSRLILQLGTSEEPILAITIALGALHRDLEHRTLGSQADNEQSIRSQLYSKAVCLLNDHITHHGWQKLEVTLVCCILCTGFEWLCGNSEAAALHLQAGASILRSWQSQNVGGPSYWSPAGHLIRGKLAPFYTRLALQSYTVSKLSIPWSNQGTTNTSIEPFKSIEHARDSLCNLLAEVYLVPETNQLLRRRTPQSQREQARFETLLSRWAKHFTDFTSSTRLRLNFTERYSSQAQASILILWLIHTCATLLLSQITPPPPSTSVDTRAGFERILNVAEALLSWSYTPSFSIDFGWVAPLAYVVESCPHPDIKQRALAFLAHQDTHEGSWSSQAALRNAQLAQAVTARPEIGARVESSPATIHH